MSLTSNFLLNYQYFYFCFNIIPKYNYYLTSPIENCRENCKQANENYIQKSK